jgi:hypothetical protein
MCPVWPSVIWAMDCQFDTTADERTLKVLNVIDEFTREALVIEVDRAVNADEVVNVLDRLGPDAWGTGLRFDNGPEVIADAVNDWCRFNGTGSLFIDPGAPWQNACIESFNGRLRDELLNSWRFDSLREARVIIEDWRIDSNATGPTAPTAEPAVTGTSFKKVKARELRVAEVQSAGDGAEVRANVDGETTLCLSEQRRTRLWG